MSELYEEIMAGLQEALDIERGIKKPKSVVVLPTNPKIVRKKLKLSQPKFAKFIGVKTATLRNWEYGRRKIPETAQRLMYIAEKRPDVILEMVS